MNSFLFIGQEGFLALMQKILEALLASALALSNFAIPLTHFYFSMLCSGDDFHSLSLLPARKQIESSQR
jgi:hypothetical protein